MPRIFSDLHVYDASSRVQRLEDLEPLLEGVGELWINGDCCDSQSGMSSDEVAAVRRFFRERVPAVRFHTGNHDPDISEHHEGSLADGRVWVTHGDVFFDDIVPWSHLRPVLCRRIDAARSQMPDGSYARLEERLAIIRRACLGVRQEWDPANASWTHRLRRLARILFPPRQPWAMARAWWTFPDLVARRTPAWRPGTQVVVAGHTHFPCVHRRGELVVVNTGAFAGPFGALAVDVDGERVAVRKVEPRRGAWRLGRTVAELRLRRDGRTAD